MFNLFLNDLDITPNCQDSHLTKYADDTNILVTARKNTVDESQETLNAFLEWTEVNGMACNTGKCKELCLTKRSVAAKYSPLCGTEQNDRLTLLGVTLQSDCLFTSHVKGKLQEANRCLYIIRSLRKEGYTQLETDHPFKAIVLPKITYALPVYGASQADLNITQWFLKRCNKRPYTSELINIFDLLEKCERRLFTEIKNNVDHALSAVLPKVRVIKEVKITNMSITTN